MAASQHAPASLLVNGHSEFERSGLLAEGAVSVGSSVPAASTNWVTILRSSWSCGVNLRGASCGAKRAVFGDRVFDYPAGKYLIVGIELPIVANVVQASVDEPFLGLGLTLKPFAVASLLLESGAGGDRPAPSGIAVSDAGPELLDPIVRLLRLLDRPDDISVLGAAIEREILWRLVKGEQGAMVRQLGLADSRLSQISRTVRWIRDHHAEMLRIEDLAHIANMSATSFFRHFRAVTSLTPIQYQKQIRLQEARAKLLAHPGDVAAVGYTVGYDSRSQFSREYRRLFGAPPGRDVARLLRTSVSASQA